MPLVCLALMNPSSIGLSAIKTFLTLLNVTAIIMSIEQSDHYYAIIETAPFRSTLRFRALNMQQLI